MKTRREKEAEDRRTASWLDCQETVDDLMGIRGIAVPPMTMEGAGLQWRPGDFVHVGDEEAREGKEE